MMNEQPMEEELQHKKVLILSDGKVGHLNQSLGLAEALGVEPDIFTLRKRKFGSFLSFFWPPLKVVKLPEAPWPDMVIATGNLTVPVSKWMKMQNPATFLVQIMSPLNRFGGKESKSSLALFDVVVSSVHDHLPSYPNVVQVTGAPNCITPALLEQEKGRWAPTFDKLGKKKLAVLVGGKNSRMSFDEDQAEELANALAAFSEKQGYKIMMTTSRRTGEVQTKILQERFSGSEHYIWDGKGNNPYSGMLAHADAIVVTADSVSMVSEACTTGKPVYIYGLGKSLYAPKMGKFNRFYALLKKQGRVCALGEEMDEPLYPLADAEHAAGFIRAKLRRLAR